MKTLCKHVHAAQAHTVTREFMFKLVKSSLTTIKPTDPSIIYFHGSKVLGNSFQGSKYLRNILGSKWLS